MTNQEQYERMIIVDSITISDFAKRISDYCKNFEWCFDCRFFIKGIGCIFNNVTPDEWEEFIDENIRS